MINQLPVELTNRNIFKKLIANIFHTTETSMICTSYCLDDLKRDEIPKYSALNNMILDITPPVIKELNFYEKLLIHQAKCFQTIIQMNKTPTPKKVWILKLAIVQPIFASIFMLKNNVQNVISEPIKV